MVHINWRPTSTELRRWGAIMLLGTAAGGCVLYFLLGQPAPARVLWIFGALSFASGITGTKAALPFYFVWMSLVWGISHTLGALALAVVFYLVVTPIALAARLCRRDRLQLRRPPPGAPSLWEEVPPMRSDRFDRPF